MNRDDFLRLLQEHVLILDGATGTQLQKNGMPLGVCPEQWVLDNPHVLVEIQRQYVAAGSQAVYTCTFGANRIKLAEFGLSEHVHALNTELARISRKAAGQDAFVAGDMAPTGRFVRPFGDLDFEDAVSLYREQAQGLLAGGVDFFVIETMLDIQEARAALLAVRELCDLPVCVSMTFDQNGRTLTGTDPITALITLQALGADAVGCNCSTGPSDMIKVIAAMKPYAKVPLLAKPNAGLPKLIDGKTIFDLSAQQFGEYVADFIKAGVNLFGGCCGTSPDYIAQIKKHALGQKPLTPSPQRFSAVTSARKTVFVGRAIPIVVVGERINPTGKKRLQAELMEGKTAEVRRLASEQLEQGASVLDVNVGMPGIDEQATMIKMVELLSPVVDAPLCLDSSSPKVLEAALRIYPGRALINSISGEETKLQRLLPIAAKYGAMFVLLPLDDTGVPPTAEQRYAVIERVYRTAEQYGVTKDDIVVDGLVMTVSADQKAAIETLKVISWCSTTFGCSSIVGLSNVSFGLPERGWINAAFLAMAAASGLTMVIANPSSDVLMYSKMASDVLTGRDKNSGGWIQYTNRNTDRQLKQPPAEAKRTPAEKLYDAVLKGDREGIAEILDAALRSGLTPADAVDTCLIPAIVEVGTLFDTKVYYLPQLIQSAETMKAAFEILEPLLTQTGPKAVKKKAAIVLATVKGDIHDIGKNIVGLMLKNYGFTVYDLGKDVSEHAIIRAAKETGAEIIGLSALMTTTMVEMRKVIALARAEGLSCKFMIGGAVVNQHYADEIGADGYAADAYAAVKLAESLTQ